jgi:predicted DNA-binding transcriptional regulator AlpA
MSRRRREIDCPRDPIGLSAEEAAAFVGVSASIFYTAVERGLMPAGRQLFGRTLWDADEIALAFRRLPKRQASENAKDLAVDWHDLAV